MANHSPKILVVFLVIWALMFIANILWLRKEALKAEGGRMSKKHISLETDSIIDGQGKKYAKAGITAVWAQEPDGSFTHRGGIDYSFKKAEADAKMEKCNSVYIQYGDRPVRIVKPILRRSVAESLAQAIEDWRTT